jgi:hypothetical protein
MNEEDRPERDDQAKDDRQDASDQETGDDGHGRFALVPT